MSSRVTEKSKRDVASPETFNVNLFSLWSYQFPSRAAKASGQIKLYHALKNCSSHMAPLDYHEAAQSP